MQEASGEWDRKNLHGVHVLSEWATQNLANLGYRHKDIPPIDFQPPLEWRMPSEPTAHHDEEDVEEEIDQLPFPTYIALCHIRLL